MCSLTGCCHEGLGLLCTARHFAGPEARTAPIYTADFPLKITPSALSIFSIIPRNNDHRRARCPISWQGLAFAPARQSLTLTNRIAGFNTIQAKTGVQYTSDHLFGKFTTTDKPQESSQPRRTQSLIRKPYLAFLPS